MERGEEERERERGEGGRKEKGEQWKDNIKNSSQKLKKSQDPLKIH